MNLQQIIDALELTPLTEAKEFSAFEPSCGYAADLLSCVMSGAARHSIWVTLQAHGNIIAVASLLDLSAIIITEGASPEDATITKANEEGVILLSTKKTTFEIAGKLWELGIRCKSSLE